MDGVPSWIMNYMIELPDEKADARLYSVALAYKKAIEDSWQKHAGWQATADENRRKYGVQARVPKYEEMVARIEYDHKQKALAIAREYIKDTDTLNKINPEIKAEYTEAELHARLKADVVNEKAALAEKKKAQEEQQQEKEARFMKVRAEYLQKKELQKTDSRELFAMHYLHQAVKYPEEPFYKKALKADFGYTDQQINERTEKLKQVQAAESRQQQSQNAAPAQERTAQKTEPARQPLQMDETQESYVDAIARLRERQRDQGRQR